MLTSVIVPMYGRADLSEQLLKTLAVDGCDYELVVVDNGSDDDGATRRLLAGLDAQVVTVARNVGFTRAANIGASAASGDVLVFLNNDTEVPEGWLDPMLAGFDDHEVGIVGCKLVYPDGRLQHGGVKLVRTQGILEARHDDSAPDTRRHLTAVTGACMAVSRDCWRDVGGFFEGYFNGYEDVDLCLSAVTAGWKVLYEPATVIVHHEGASGPSRWFKVRENVALLQERWLGQFEPNEEV